MDGRGARRLQSAPPRPGANLKCSQLPSSSQYESVGRGGQSAWAMHFVASMMERFFRCVCRMLSCLASRVGAAAAVADASMEPTSSAYLLYGKRVWRTETGCVTPRDAALTALSGALRRSQSPRRWERLLLHCSSHKSSTIRHSRFSGSVVRRGVLLELFRSHPLYVSLAVDSQRFHALRLLRLCAT